MLSGVLTLPLQKRKASHARFNRMNAINLNRCPNCGKVSGSLRFKVGFAIITCLDCGFEAEAQGDADNVVELWNSVEPTKPQT